MIPIGGVAGVITQTVPMTKSASWEFWLFLLHVYVLMNTSQRTHCVIITSLLHQNNVATSFWRNNDVNIAPRARWGESDACSYLSHEVTTGPPLLAEVIRLLLCRNIIGLLSRGPSVIHGHIFILHPYRDLGYRRRHGAGTWGCWVPHRLYVRTRQ